MTMRRVLAIEPDRRQAVQLKSIARRLNVELLLAESAGGALASLDERLPDLILTPALLSRRDDLALTERLRELGDAAAHIQTLTIPMFETAKPPARGGGILAALWREKTAAEAPTGRAADMFAEEIRVYLGRAAETRQTRADRQPSSPEAPFQPAQPPNVPHLETGDPVQIGDTPEALADMATPAAVITPDEVVPPSPFTPLLHASDEPSTAVPAAEAIAHIEGDSGLQTDVANRQESTLECLEISADAVSIDPDDVAGNVSASILPSETTWVAEKLLSLSPGDEPLVFIDPEEFTAAQAAGSVDDGTVQVPAEPAPVPLPISGRAPAAGRPRPGKAPSPTRRATRKHEPDLTSDEWSDFDPARCHFAMLVKRLDEIAAQSQEELAAKLDEVAVHSQASFAAQLDEIMQRAPATGAKP